MHLLPLFFLVCRPRSEEAPAITRNRVSPSTEKRDAAPHWIRLTRIANIRPVDLAQAAIGPGMESLFPL